MAIDNVSAGDVATAAKINEIIDTLNALGVDVDVIEADTTGTPTFSLANEYEDDGQTFRCWVKVTITRAEDVGGYVIQYRETGDTAWFIIHVAQTEEGNPVVTTPYLQENTQYDFRAAYVSQIGEIGDWSDIQNITTASSTHDLGPPTGLQATAIQGGVILDWTDLGLLGESYNIYVNTADDFETAVLAGTIIGTVFVWWVTDPETEYVAHYFWVTTVSKSGVESDPTDSVTETPAQAVTEDMAADAITSAKIADGAVVTAALANLCVETGKLANLCVDVNKLGSDAVIAEKIAAGAVVADKIAANAVLTDKINANAVTAAKIAANTITAAEIAAATITATELGAGCITTEKLDAGAVTAAKIAANTITANEIAANAISTSELNALAVTTAKLDAGAVTTAKLTSDWIIGKRFQTAAAGARIEFDTTSIRGYNAVPTLNFEISAADGAAYCGAGNVVLAANGISVNGQYFFLNDAGETARGVLFGDDGGVTGNAGLIIYTNQDLSLVTATGTNIRCVGDVIPETAAIYDIGNADNYWGEINYKTLTDRGCPVWMEKSEATQILKNIRPHATIKSMHKLKGKNAARFDESTLPDDFRPAEGEGIKFDLFVYTMYHCMRDLVARIESLEAQLAAKGIE